MTFRRYLLFCPLFLAAPALILTPAQAQQFTTLDDEAEAGGYDVTAQITALPAEFMFARADNGDGYDLKLAAGNIQLWKIRNKKPALLASAPLKTKGPAAFVAQRRGPRWRFLLNGLTALEAEDDAFMEGQIATRGAIRDARVQPVEAIQFDDDFMRVAKDVAMKDALQNPRIGVKISTLQLQESLWNAVQGTWATTGLTENVEAQVAQSANPFAFRPMSQGTNVSLTGHPFWSDYSVAASMQPQGATELGLLVDAQDSKNYLGLFWSDSGAPQLRAVVNGKITVLDSATGFGHYDPQQWYRLQLSDSNGQLRGFIDDQEVVRAKTGLFSRGEIGLFANLPEPGDDKKGVGAVFDDVSARSITDFYDDFGSRVPGRWTTIAGNWNLTGAAKATDTRGAYAVMGESDWSDYRVGATLKIPADGAAGLLLHHQAGKGAYLLRITGSKSKLTGAGKAQIVLIEGGKTKVLGETTFKGRFDISNAAWSFSNERGYLSARRGDALVVDAFDTSLKGGHAGIYAQNGKTPAVISDFSVQFPTDHSNWAKVPDLYEVDMQAQTMGGWSTPQGFWIARTSGDKTQPGTAMWHKGEFFGDEDLKLPLPDLAGGKTLKMLFTGKDNSRLTLTLSQKDTLVADLSDGTKTWSGKATLATGAPIDTMHRGSFFIVRSGDTVLLSTRVG